MIAKHIFIIIFFCFFSVRRCQGVGSGSESAIKRLYEQSCSTSEDCDETLGLLCQNGACRCDPGGATVYSVMRHRCVGAAGRECLRHKNATFCVSNAQCNDYGYMHLCTCKDGFYQSKDGNCYPIAKYGDVCLEEEFSCGDTVSTSISCVEKKCRCLLGEDNQFYDHKEKKCTSFAGGQCLPHYYKACPNNSFCGEVNEEIRGASFLVGHKCVCTPGYSYTRNKQCLARYGTRCGINSPCNYDEFLGCLNGVCQCRNPLNEMFDGQSCAILVGSNCKVDGPQKCVENAACIPESNTTSVKHVKCKCQTGYSPTPLNTCMKDINISCLPGDCNVFNALACINATCNCVDSFLSYDKTSKACVSLVGLPCGTLNVLHDDKSLEVTVLCESNAVCSKISQHYNGPSKRFCRPSTPSTSTNSKV